MENTSVDISSMLRALNSNVEKHSSVVEKNTVDINNTMSDVKQTTTLLNELFDEISRLKKITEVNQEKTKKTMCRMRDMMDVKYNKLDQKIHDIGNATVPHVNSKPPNALTITDIRNRYKKHMVPQSVVDYVMKLADNRPRVSGTYTSHNEYSVTPRTIEFWSTVLVNDTFKKFFKECSKVGDKYYHPGYGKPFNYTP